MKEFRKKALALMNSPYCINAVGFRDVDILELEKIIGVIINSSNETISDEIAKLHKYSIATINFNKCDMENSCSGFCSECNCFLPDVDEKDWKCNVVRAEKLKTIDRRSEPEYKAWRESVFKRDGYTCQHCDEKGGRLNAHHIKPWKQYPELRYNVSNGITLCEVCHKLEHKYLREAKNGL